MDGGTYNYTARNLPQLDLAALRAEARKRKGDGLLTTRERCFQEWYTHLRTIFSQAAQADVGEVEVYALDRDLPDDVDILSQVARVLWYLQEPCALTKENLRGTAALIAEVIESLGCTVIIRRCNPYAGDEIGRLPLRDVRFVVCAVLPQPEEPFVLTHQMRIPTATPA